MAIIERKLTENDAKVLDLILRESKFKKRARVLRYVLNLPSFDEKTRNELKKVM